MTKVVNRLELLTKVFQSFLQNDITSISLTVQTDGDERYWYVSDINTEISHFGYETAFGTFLQAKLVDEATRAEDSLAKVANILSWTRSELSPPAEPVPLNTPLNTPLGTTYYRVKVQQGEGNDYKFYTVNASSVNEALQIAFALDGGVTGDTADLLGLALMYAEIVE